VRDVGGRARTLRWRGAGARAVGDSRGFAFITAVFIVFFIGMMLFGFVFFNQNEAGFAAFGRNSAEAFWLAEAGMQEGLKRLNMGGPVPGSTSFINSLAGSGNCGANPPVNCVVYQAALQNNPAIFPILSTATFAGTVRAVRVLEQAIYKPGFGNIIYGPQLLFDDEFNVSTADLYSPSSIAFQDTAPVCASGATATNLPSVQVIAGTTILMSDDTGQAPCGSTSTSKGTFTYECADGSLSEVAPTNCSGHGGRGTSSTGDGLRVHMHPMVPNGMSATDFTTVVSACPPPGTSCLGSLGITVVQATQGGTGVTYTPAGTYTPSYWSSIPATNGQVLLVTASQPFCVNSSGSVALPSPPVTGTCAAGYRYYGNQTSGTAHATRFLDWGLVTDDLSRATATTFFQPPSCATCNGGNPNGFQNGLRYVALLPSVNVLGMACQRNENPGTNVFDRVNPGSVTCTNPPTTTINSTTVTFSGTKSNPEALIIDNAGFGAVTINGTVSGTDPSNCAPANFNSSNFGMIVATGDIILAGDFFFTGLIYAQGQVTATDLDLQGGLFSANTTNAATTFPGDKSFCGGPNLQVFNSAFDNFTTVAWQDRPNNKP